MPPIADDRHLFPDEQAYIAHKRHLAAMEREEALKQAQARKMRRRAKYSDRIRRALHTLKARKRIAAIRADPERFAEYLRQRREQKKEWRRQNPERARQYDRVSYQKHREWRLLLCRAYRESHREQSASYFRDYHQNHREEKAAYYHEYYKAHREKLLAYQRAYNQSHQEEVRAKRRAYQDSHREEINAKARARYAAKKAAQAQAQQPD